jgi:hypothetical protein
VGSHLRIVSSMRASISCYWKDERRLGFMSVREWEYVYLSALASLPFPPYIFHVVLLSSRVVKHRSKGRNSSPGKANFGVM